MQKDKIIYYMKHSSPLGAITIAACEDKLVGLWAENQKYHDDSSFSNMLEVENLPIIDRTRVWLDRYFAGDKPNISDLDLAPSGTDFRQNVWKILCEIPYGELITYGEIAEIMAKKRGRRRMSSQAVGGAVGHNPISIIIPCHRVVGAGGNLTGYGGGLDMKKYLLGLEGVDMSSLFTPKKGTAL